MASEAVEFQHLSETEEVARCTVYPKHFDDAGVFSAGALIELDKLDSGKKSRYAISVASHKILGSAEEVHAYGCRTARAKNLRVFRKLGIDAALSERSFYCGYFDITVSVVLGLSCGAYSIQVLLVPEGGEGAHCEIRLIPNQQLTPTDLKEARGDMLIALVRCLRGPVPHICDPDFAYRRVVEAAIATMSAANQNSASEG